MMNAPIKAAWESFVVPMLQRPKRLQVAALCHRGEGEGKEYLLVTSRETARWIIPKGWPIRGLSLNESALVEAWEEAGVRTGDAASEPIGAYSYQKRQDAGWEIPVKTLVYSVAVKDLSEEFPEAEQRERKWVDAKAAAELVDETELKSILRKQ